MIYLLIDSPRSGAYNMAVDESLLEWVSELGYPVLRFYFWDQPTLSLGYFQRYEDRYLHPASRSLPVVRRCSGGGALVHDRELTYSFTIPAGHIFAGKERLRLYETVHRAVIGVLRNRGINAALASDVLSVSAEMKKEEDFLCFRRLAPGDIVVGYDRPTPIKIMGSAQYRNKVGSVLQHGSLLYEQSEAAPELPGLRQWMDNATMQENVAERPNGCGINMLENLRKDMLHAFSETLQCQYIDFDGECISQHGVGMTSNKKMKFDSTIAFFMKGRYLDREWLCKR